MAANEPVDADALVGALRVLAGAVVLAGVESRALIHVGVDVLLAFVSREPYKSFLVFLSHSFLKHIVTGS